MLSKTTIWRRKKRAESLGCPTGELPDNRGKHGNHSRGSSHYKWGQRLISSDGYSLSRVGKGHPLADPNGYVRTNILVMCSAIGRDLKEGDREYLLGQYKVNDIPSLIKLMAVEIIGNKFEGVKA